VDELYMRNHRVTSHRPHNELLLLLQHTNEHKSTTVTSSIYPTRYHTICSDLTCIQ